MSKATRARPLAVALVCCVAIAMSFVACGKKRGLTCEGVFAPPKGAELLCDVHRVDEHGDVHWRSYGSLESKFPFFDAYLAAANECHYGWCTKCSDPDVSHEGREIKFYDAKQNNYPTCAKAPAPSHKIVIVISETTKK
jgi:hypothetical protein